MLAAVYFNLLTKTCRWWNESKKKLQWQFERVCMCLRDVLRRNNASGSHVCRQLQIETGTERQMMVLK